MSLWSWIGDFALFNWVCNLFSHKSHTPDTTTYHEDFYSIDEVEIDDMDDEIDDDIEFDDSSDSYFDDDDY